MLRQLYSLLMLFTGFSLAMHHAFNTTVTTINNSNRQPTRIYPPIGNGTTSENWLAQSFPARHAPPIPMATDGMASQSTSLDNNSKILSVSAPLTLRMASSFERRWISSFTYPISPIRMIKSMVNETSRVTSRNTRTDSA